MRAVVTPKIGSSTQFSVTDHVGGCFFFYMKSVSLGGEKIISFYHHPETRLQGGLDFYEPFLFIFFLMSDTC